MLLCSFPESPLSNALNITQLTQDAKIFLIFLMSPATKVRLAYLADAFGNPVKKGDAKVIRVP
jgi:hypothetical protein